VDRNPEKYIVLLFFRYVEVRESLVDRNSLLITLRTTDAKVEVRESLVDRNIICIPCAGEQFKSRFARASWIEIGFDAFGAATDFVEVRESLVDRNAVAFDNTIEIPCRGSREPRGSKCKPY